MASTATFILFALFAGASALGLRVDANQVTVADEKDTEDVVLANPGGTCAQIITNEAECRAAANTLGFAFESAQAWPSANGVNIGCWSFTGSKKVNFNTASSSNFNGGWNSNVQPVCGGESNSAVSAVERAGQCRLPDGSSRASDAVYDTIAGISAQECKTRLLSAYASDPQKRQAETSGDSRQMCWIIKSSDTTYTGNGNSPYGCWMVTTAPTPAPATTTTECEYSEYLWERVSTENGHTYGQLSEFKVFDAAGTQLTPNSVTAIDNSNYHSEGPEYIFDGDLNTKYQDHGGSASPGSFMFSFSSPVKISSYEWFTPNDGSERDINSWALKGRNSGETEWTELHSVTDYAVTDNRKSQVGPFSVECVPASSSSSSGSGSGSAAKGDPHLMNLKGEAFDVMQTGNMMLLEIPRGSSPATLDLALHADIERLGVVSCGPTFITSASIAGRWIGELLEVRSGSIVKKGGHLPKHTFAIRFDGNDWLPHVEMQRTIELSRDASITALDRMFLIQVRGLDIAVSQPKRPRTFLDIQVKGLGNIQTEIGGLLGIDDHSSVEELPSGCEMSASSLSLAAMQEDEAFEWSARALL